MGGIEEVSLEQSWSVCGDAEGAGVAGFIVAEVLWERGIGAEKGISASIEESVSRKNRESVGKSAPGINIRWREVH